MNYSTHKIRIAKVNLTEEKREINKENKNSKTDKSNSRCLGRKAQQNKLLPVKFNIHTCTHTGEKNINKIRSEKHAGNFLL